MSHTSRTPRAVAATAVALALSTCFGCRDLALKRVEYERRPEDHPTQGCGWANEVDILFVIDNSGSMSDEQAKLARNFDRFIEVLEGPQVHANYRIGVTTTDRGQSEWCDHATVDNGKLQLSSCLDRPADFVFEGDDEFATACADRCLYDDADLVITPTATHLSGGVKTPRPWLESVDGVRNIPDGITMAEAFQCVGPQGIDGCGFESQLESQFVALARMRDPDESSYGFLRPTAVLAIVHITDEVDCSNNPRWSAIFSNQGHGGNQVFWSNTAQPWPTSAVCWNAGVDCTPVDPVGEYDECHSADKDIDGAPTDDPDAAVLYPLRRYVDQLRAVDDLGEEFGPSRGVIVALIGGVDAAGDAHYRDHDGGIAGHVEEFGVGPGCRSGGEDDPQSAVPPVRLREFVEHFEGELFSVCSDDYATALERVAERIGNALPPACYAECVADTDPAAPGVQARCEVSQLPAGSADEEPVDECAKEVDGAYAWANGDYVQPADDVDVCFAMLADDAERNNSPYDDLSASCLAQELNLELRIARRPAAPTEPGTSIHATCEVSDSPELDCPGR